MEWHINPTPCPCAAGLDSRTEKQKAEGALLRNKIRKECETTPIKQWSVCQLSAIRPLDQNKRLKKR